MAFPSESSAFSAPIATAEGELGFEVDQDTDARAAIPELQQAIGAYVPLQSTSVSEAGVLDALVFFDRGGAGQKLASATLGINVDETVMVDGELFPVYEWATKDCTEFLAAEADLLLFVTNDLWSHGKDWVQSAKIDLENGMLSDLDPAGLEELEAECFLAMETSLPVKICVLFGLSRAELAAFDGALAEIGSKHFRLASHQRDKGNDGKAVGHLEDGLKPVVTKRFKTALSMELGAAAAGMVLAEIGARFIPFIGWAWIAGELVWGAGTQIFVD